MANVRKSNVPAKYKHIDFKPPASVGSAAEKGLAYRQQATPSNKGGLTVEEAAAEGIGSGVQRAVNLKNRDTLSPKTIRQMNGFFARHEKNKSVAAEHKNEPWNDKGYVSWLLWGGDAGKTWVEKIMDQMEKADEATKKEAQDAHTADEDGSYMSVQALKTLAANATKLLSLIQPDTVLPDWVESKLTRANTDLGDVAQFYSSQAKASSDEALRKNLIRLAHANPRLRPHLLPLLYR